MSIHCITLDVNIDKRSINYISVEAFMIHPRTNTLYIDAYNAKVTVKYRGKRDRDSILQGMEIVKVTKRVRD